MLDPRAMLTVALTLLILYCQQRAFYVASTYSNVDTVDSILYIKSMIIRRGWQH